MSSMLADELNSEESRGLLSAVDRMREILHDEKIRLPEIVVVGDQSVGKSSVLEAISGIQLPRAQNICTRCPLELRMKSTTDKEYAVIRNGKSSEDQAKTISDMNEIANEVTRLTNEIAGDGPNVSLDPIYLTVYKRDIPYDLTLIDLPGITRNPLPGQAKDIHQQILNLINKYIEPPTAVVLHVVPSSVDFTTSESMKLAKDFDPECERQLIAVSKIDKYDKGIAEKLQGEGPGSMKLQLGCVAVLNRSQDEIDRNISFEEMKEREKQFFITHRDAFQHLPEEYKGVDQLVRKLAIIQQGRIRSTFPETIEELREQIRKKYQELRTIPVALSTEHDCWTRFQSMVNEFREIIRARANGDYDFRTKINMIDVDATTSSKTKPTTSTLINSKTTTSALIVTDDRIAYYIYKFQQQFQHDVISKFSEFLSLDYKKRVMKAIDDAAGVSLPNFPSFQIIEHLFHEEFQKLPSVCYALHKNICDYIRENLLKLFHETFDKEYPRLIQRLKEVIIAEVDAAQERAKERIKEILDMEYRLFTLSEEYMDMVDKVTQALAEENAAKENKTASTTTTTTTTTTAPQTLPSSASASNLLSRASNLIVTSLSRSVLNDPLTVGTNEARAAPAIQIALDSYCKIVQKRLIDNISQVCYHQFITRCTLTIDQNLTLAVTPTDLVRFMKEPLERTIRRDKLNRTIKAYEEALKLGQEYM